MPSDDRESSRGDSQASREPLAGISTASDGAENAQRLERYQAFAERIGHGTQRGPFRYFYVSAGDAPERFSPRDIAGVWRDTCAAVAAGQVPPTLNCYVHVPFCDHRCSYCTYHTHVCQQPVDRELWVEHLEAELDYFGPIFSAVELTNLSIGGGTPTSLTEGELERLLTRLGSWFRVWSNGVRTFECNPLSYTERKAEIFQHHGFNRVSIGVQTMTPRALGKANRRYQTAPMVLDALRSALALGFWVNIDLITGLPGDTESAFFAGLEELMTLRPHEVTLTPLFHDSPPAVFQEAGAWGLNAARMRAKLEVIARDAGYTLCPSPFEPKMWRTREPGEPGNVAWEPRQSPNYSFSNAEPVSLFGLGPSARCYAFGRLIYEYGSLLPDRPFDPDELVACGRRISVDEEMRRYAMFNLYEEPALCAQTFVRLFRARVEDVLGEELRAMQRLGLVKAVGDSWVLAPSDPIDRFAACMFLLEQATAEEAMSSCDAEDSEPPDDSEQPEQPIEILLELTGHGQKLRVVLCSHDAQQSYCRHGGGFAFFIPSSQSDGLELGPEQQRLEEAFRQLFDRAVSRPPATLEELAQLVATDDSAGLQVTRIPTDAGPEGIGPNEG